MKSKLNFSVVKHGHTYDLHQMGIWVESFRISSPNLQRTKMNVPGSTGTIVSSTKNDERYVYIKMQIESDSMKQYDDLKHRIYDLFFTIDKFTIIRDLTPNRYINVIQEDYYEIDNITCSDGEFEVTLTMPDPYIYGQEQTDVIPGITGPILENDGKLISNEGTADAYPVFRTQITENITRFSIENRNNLTPQGSPRKIILGQTQSPSQEVIDPLTLVMHDTMRSTASWQNASEVDNGFIAGEMAVNQHGFYASLYGSAIDMKRWQGPSMIRSIGQPLQDFRADIYIRQMNVGKETGMIEVYFRDANGNRVAKIGFEDAWSNATKNQGKVRIGTGTNYHDIYTEANPTDGWNNFNGIIRLERKGNVWTPYFAQITSNGAHVWQKSTLRYTDNAGNAMAPITHVQVAIRKYPGTVETEQSIKEIKVYRLNEVNAERTESLVFNETMTNTNGWNVSAEVDNGIISGKMIATIDGFRPDSYGSGNTIGAWQGPSLTKPIGRHLRDFRVEVYIEQWNVGKETGMIEVYLRDAFGRTVGKIGFEDPWKTVTENQGKAQIGDYETGHSIYARADSPSGWNNFDGVMMLERIDNNWRMYFAKIQLDGSHVWVKSTLAYIDHSRRFMDAVAYVQIAMRKMTGTVETDQYVKGLKIYEINRTVGQPQVPVGLKSGDVVEIDTSRGLVTVNGETRTDLLELSSEFFTLVEGLNQIVVNPPRFTTEIKWRNRYL